MVMTTAIIIGAGVSIDQSNKANKAQKRAQAEQRAGNKAQSMQERRNQLREERQRRAALVATSAASGTEGSAGELGALGAMSTKLGSNLGMNLGALQTAENISIFQQQANDYLNRAQTARTVSGAVAQGYQSYKSTK